MQPASRPAPRTATLIQRQPRLPPAPPRAPSARPPPPARAPPAPPARPRTPPVSRADAPARVRPVGVTILGFGAMLGGGLQLVFLVAVLVLVSGFEGSVNIGDPKWLLMPVFAAVTFAVGIGLWRGRPWGRWGALAANVLGLGFGLVAGVLWWMQPVEPSRYIPYETAVSMHNNQVVVSFGEAAFCAFLLWYLTRPGVRAWFEPLSPPPPRGPPRAPAAATASR